MFIITLFLFSITTLCNASHNKDLFKCIFKKHVFAYEHCKDIKEMLMRYFKNIPNCEKQNKEVDKVIQFLDLKLREKEPGDFLKNAIDTTHYIIFRHKEFKIRDNNKASFKEHWDMIVEKRDHALTTMYKSN